MRHKNEISPTRYEFACPSCGNSFESQDAKGGICNVCEMFSHMAPEELEKEQETSQLLSDLHTYLLSKAWEQAAKTADAIAEKSDPYLLYGAGIAYLTYSNAEYSNTDYNLHGYMEENSDHKENSIRICYKAKQYLEQAIWVCRNDPNIASNEGTSYIKFIASVKLDKLEDMQIYLNEISGKGTDGITAKYANMVYYSYAGDIKRSNQFAHSLAVSGIETSSYYMARNMVKLHKYRTARKLLERLLAATEMPEARNLLEYVKAALSA